MVPSMGDTRRMHTVAASYLAPWGVVKNRKSPAVWRYGRTDRRPIPIAIRDAAVWKDIYAFIDDCGERNIEIEKMFVNVEGIL